MEDTTTLEIEFEENLSDNSIKMIKDILWDSLGFKTKIKENEKSDYYCEGCGNVEVDDKLNCVCCGLWLAG